MARTDGLKKTPGITKANARELQKRSVEKRQQNIAERKVMHDIVIERVSEEDRAAICDALKEKAKNGDKDAIKLLLQLMGEMPDDKQVIDLKVPTITEADAELLKAVQSRYEAQ